MSPSSLEGLPNEAIIILDFILNYSNVLDADQYSKYIAFITGKENDKAIYEARKLLEERGILIKKDYTWTIDESLNIKEALLKSFTENGITEFNAKQQLEAKVQKDSDTLNQFIKILSRAFEFRNEKTIGFSNFEWRGELGRFLDDLVKLPSRSVFWYEWQSRKGNYYKDYIFRTWPFDYLNIIRDIVMKNLNVQDLGKDEWYTILMLLVSPSHSVEYSALKQSVNITESQLNETLQKLKEKGFITRSYQSISLSTGLVNSISEYIVTNIIPTLREEDMTRLKSEIKKHIATLGIVLDAKRISDAVNGEDINQPVRCKRVQIDSLKEDTKSLDEVVKKGLAARINNGIIFWTYLIDGIVKWVKSYLQETTAYIIPADEQEAAKVFSDIFLECKEYVKIQDPYLTKRTFNLIRYIPKVEIKFMTGINLEDDNPDHIHSNIKKLKEERDNKFDILFLGRGELNKAPFHARLIMSSNVGWLLDNSISQAGRKEIILTRLPADFMHETVEQKFDGLWNKNKAELGKRGITKLNAEEWYQLLKSKS